MQIKDKNNRQEKIRQLAKPLHRKAKEEGLTEEEIRKDLKKMEDDNNDKGTDGS